MALNGFLTLSGPNGPIDGSSTLVGKEGQIFVYGFTQNISTDRHANNEFTFTKPVDRSTPLLLSAMNRGDALSATFRFYEPDESGQESQYYTVTLTGATISNVRQEMLNNKYPENMSHEVREHVSFTYDSIEWTHEPSGRSATA